MEAVGAHCPTCRCGPAATSPDAAFLAEISPRQNTAWLAAVNLMSDKWTHPTTEILKEMTSTGTQPVKERTAINLLALARERGWIKTTSHREWSNRTVRITEEGLDRWHDATTTDRTEITT